MKLLNRIKNSLVNPFEIRFLDYVKRNLEERLKLLPDVKNEMGVKGYKQDVKKTKEWLECVKWMRRYYFTVYKNL